MLLHVMTDRSYTRLFQSLMIRNKKHVEQTVVIYGLSVPQSRDLCSGDSDSRQARKLQILELGSPL